MFDSIASPLPGNVSSVGYEATSTAEFGLGIVFAPGTPRVASSVTVIMSSWGCVSGHWFVSMPPAPCVTPAGATFTHPLTVHVYAVGAGNTVGALLESRTQTFTMPFRPSADAVKCTGADAGKWFDPVTGTCKNGLAFPVTFDLPGVPLPNQVIVTVAYNTTHYGAAPLGQGTACFLAGNNCPYDSLNVSAETSGPAVGTFLDPNSAYLSSTWGGAYCDQGMGGTGTLRLDSAGGKCWTGFMPQIRVNSAPGDAYQIRYFSNLNIGDSVINFTNTGAAANAGGLSDGNICVNTYTYSPDEQLVSCCSCLVTPNGLASLSVTADLTSNTLTPIIPNSVVVKLVATRGGGTTTTCNAATVGSPVSAGYAPGMGAWGSTLHALPVTIGSPATTYGVTETPFAKGALTEPELVRMAQLCSYIQANGSGYGICKSCRTGGLGANKR